MVAFQIKAEEAALTARFGNDYVEYTHQVNPTLPRLQ
jgi:protein-S-isoprenylcysteine O-methyltransferase Ste14